MKFPDFDPRWLLLGFPLGMFLTLIFCGEPSDPRTLVGFCREFPVFLLMLWCVLWTVVYGIIENVRHFLILWRRIRRGIGNYKRATWFAWSLVNVLQPILTVGYIVWYFNRFF